MERREGIQPSYICFAGKPLGNRIRRNMAEKAGNDPASLGLTRTSV